MALTGFIRQGDCPLPLSQYPENGSILCLMLPSSIWSAEKFPNACFTSVLYMWGWRLRKLQWGISSLLVESMSASLSPKLLLLFPTSRMSHVAEPAHIPSAALHHGVQVL